MQITLRILLLVLCSSLITFAQTEKNEENSNKDYSESRSYRPQRTYKPKLKKKKRKTKDSKVVKVFSKSLNTTVKIPVTAYDKNGKFIDDLKPDEIEIYEDGVKQEITNFGISNDPLNIILLIDTSPSTDILLEELRQAAKKFVQDIDVKHNVRVARFDNKVRFISKKNHTRKSLMNSIDDLDYKSGTAFYDSVQMFDTKTFGELTGQNIVVVFTDGVDTISRKFDYETSINKAENSNVVYFGIYFNTYFAITMKQRYRTNRKGFGYTGSEYALGYQYLNELVASTGGVLLNLKRDVDKIKPAFGLVNKMINKQYFIEYENNSTKSGRKNLKVRIERPNLVIRTRDNYYVGN